MDLKSLFDALAGKIPLDEMKKLFVPTWLSFFVLQSLIYFKLTIVPLIEQITLVVFIGFVITNCFAIWFFMKKIWVSGSIYFGIKSRLCKIKKYSNSKKGILLLAFSTGDNEIRHPDTIETAEMVADGVLLGRKNYFTVKNDVWQRLNSNPSRRDKILNFENSDTIVKEFLARQKSSDWPY